MRKYWILPHTADIRLKLTGDSLIELFTAGLEGIGKILCQTKPTGPPVTLGVALRAGPPSLVEEISLRATDQTTLLIDFLSEIVGRAYTQKAVFTRVVFAELNPTNLKAKISGVKVRQFDEDIKAVTYHEANIVKNNQGAYETTVVLDI